MKVIISKFSGFCFGVKEAVNSAYELINENNIYMLGEVVHNPQVVNELASKGLTIINEINEIKNSNGAKVLIRAHGVPKNIIDELKTKNIKIIDKTCPKVKKIHRIVYENYSKGHKILIVGKSEHPEVIGINGWCENSAYIIKDLSEIKNKNIDASKSICVVCQTTYSPKIYKEIVDYFKLNNYKIIENDTICNSTYERQDDAKLIARDVDCVIIVGGKKSSNTTKLAEICKTMNTNSFLIETKEDIDIDQIKCFDSIGIITGASTPNKSVTDLIEFLKTNLDIQYIDHNYKTSP